jgi:type II secretory pathway predicted ATPase ExeA
VLETECVALALERLANGLGAREPFQLVTGEPGTGKTTLLRAAIARWGANATVAFVANPAMNRIELLEEIVRRFGVEPAAGATKPQLLANLETAIADAKAHGCVPVIVIDDAHEASPELLGELRLLVNASAQAGGPLEIVLAGLGPLETRLAEPAFAALRQRVAVHVVTQAFSQPESRRYVHEIVAATEPDPAGVFPKKACREIHAFAAGMPRAIQTLAAEAQRRATMAGEFAVSPAHVREAAAALGFAGAESAADTLETEPAEPSAQATAPHPAPAAPVPGRVEVAGETPTARREPRVAALAGSADDAPILRPEIAAGEELKPPGDPVKVTDWVGRFISPGEPRFGDLIGTGQLSAFVEEDWPAEAVPADAEGAKPAPKRRKLGRKLRRGTVRPQRPEWLGTLALVLVIFAALVVLAGPTKRMIASGMNAMSAAAEKGAPGVESPADDAAAVPTPEEVTDAPATAKNGAVAEVNRSTQRAGGSLAAASKVSVQAPPKPAPSTSPVARSETPASQSTANPAEKWALDVGTYIDPGAADMDRERLRDGTGLNAWIVRGTSGGAPTYKVVLGTYSSHERAEISASMLLERNLVSEANVIPLPPKSQRQ